MRKIIVATAVVCLVFSFQPFAVRNVDSAQNSVSFSTDSSCDWPMFGRTPDGNRVVPDGCGPDGVEFDLKWLKKVSWGQSYQPVFSENKFFVSYHDDQALSCLDSSNGELLWKFQSKNYIGTPVCFENKVFFGSAGVFYCLDSSNGKVIWQVNIPRMKNTFAYNLLIYKNKLYFSFNGNFYCISAIDGSVVWNVDKVFQGVDTKGNAIHDGKVFFLHNYNELYCLDTDKGSRIWTFKAEKNKGYSSDLIVASGKVFFSTYESLYCLDEVSGKMIWKNTNISRGFAYYKGNLIAISNGKLVFMNPDTGEVSWESEMHNFQESPVIYNQKIFCVSNSEGKIYIYDFQKRKLLNSFESLSCESFLISKNGIYVSSSNGLSSCYVSGTGKPSQQIPKRIEIQAPYKVIDFCKPVGFTAKVFDQNGQVIENAPVQWSVDPEYGTIDSSGLFTPKKTGKVKITCKSGALSESITIDVIEFLTVNSEGIRIDVVKPKKLASKTIVYTNNSDKNLSVGISSSLNLVTVSPSSFVLEPGKSQEVEFSAQLASFAPVPDTEFIITATYDTCAKQLKGLLSSSLPFACLSASPDALAFGLVKRGNEKTIAVYVLSEVDTKVSINSSEAWIAFSPKEITLKAGVSTTLIFKIHASSLPPASKLSANIIIKSDTAFCDTLTIPVTVETEESIAIKLKIDSKSATINSQERALDAPPKIIGGRTMVPLRFISEAFGCSIEWDAKQQRIGIVRYDISVNLWIGKDYVEVNGQRVKIDAPPVIVGGRTMVPLRFIAEPFGASVNWNAQTKEITIVWPKS